MPDLSGTVLEGKYELIRLLGEGGMGTVYEAKHRLIGRRLAVKFLHPHYVTSEEVVTRFQREAQAAAAIGHENIIDVTDMGQTPEGAPFLVMEYLDGLDLRDLLAEVGILSVEEASHIMVQALSALQSAHDAGIIHRDLKPENIYLIEKSDRKNYVKLLDFGISKFKSLEGEGAKGLTQTGTVLGTPYYMSPEQARGDQNIGPKSDIYAMGVILFQMLTGKLPFDAPNYNALLIKILTEDPPDPLTLRPDLPLDAVETIKIAMSREPADRYNDCTEFRRRLASYVPGASTNFQTKMTAASRSAIRVAMATNPTPLEMTRSGGIAPQKKRAPLIVGLTSATAVVVMTALYFLLFQNPNDRVESPPTVPIPLAAKIETPTPTTPPEPVETAKVLPEEVQIRLIAKPSSAKISIDGVTAEDNPYESSVPKDDAVHRVTITAVGYDPLEAEIRFDRDQALAYTLSKAETIKTTTSRHRSSRQSSSKTKSGSSAGSSAKPEKTTPTTTAKSSSSSRSSRRRIDDEDPWK